MTETLDQARHDLALANRMLAHEGVIDAFGVVGAKAGAQVATPAPIASAVTR